MLAEGAVIEALRRSGQVALHRRLENALMMYDARGASALNRIYRAYIDIAAAADVPIAICTPTWRANRARLAEARIAGEVNGDAVRFLKRLRDGYGAARGRILIGGLIGCQNDCYQPTEALAKADAQGFHAWQIRRLAAAGVDFLLGATLPAVSEAAGMALAMAQTQIPYIISFVINRQGRVLDGSSLSQAFDHIDRLSGGRPPLGYMINCAYPSFLRGDREPRAAVARLIGFQANASSLDHAQLDGAATLRADSIADWGRRMIELHHRYGLKILGGCCGTGPGHLRYIAEHIRCPWPMPIR